LRLEALPYFLARASGHIANVLEANGKAPELAAWLDQLFYRYRSARGANGTPLACFL
jgi:hypothetical protein